MGSKLQGGNIVMEGPGRALNKQCLVCYSRKAEGGAALERKGRGKSRAGLHNTAGTPRNVSHLPS